MESFLKNVAGHQVRFTPEYAEVEMEVRYRVDIGDRSYRMRLVDEDFRFDVLEGIPEKIIDLEEKLSDVILQHDM